MKLHDLRLLPPEKGHLMNRSYRVSHGGLNSHRTIHTLCHLSKISYLLFVEMALSIIAPQAERNLGARVYDFG